ncbi:hypothetical protein BHE74_00020267, partial [Ensete ventricosum]
ALRQKQSICSYPSTYAVDTGINPILHKMQVSDISLADYIAVTPPKHATYLPHTAGRYSVKRFRKAQCPIIERLTNSLMMHGRNNGKKLMAVCIIMHTMEIIHLLTDTNPIQVIVDAIINSIPLLVHLSYRCPVAHAFNSYAIKKKDEIERVAKANR